MQFQSVDTRITAKAFALIGATLARAALQGLARIASVSDPALAEPVMMSTNQLRGRLRSLEGSGLVISFTETWRWTVHVEPGHVRSPRNLSYPTLRLAENGTALATVGFDAETAGLTVSDK